MHSDHQKLLKKAQVLNQAKDLPGAVEAYAAFLAREPKQAWVWADYAGQLVQLGRSDEAFAACHTALELDPLCLAARNNLGCILMWQDQLDEAEEQFRSVLMTDWKRLDARLNLAECLLKKKDLAGTRKVLDGAGRLPPSAFPHLMARHAAQWASLGYALLETQDLQGAEVACNRALQIETTNFMAKANLGAIDMARGHLDNAEACFRRLIAKQPGKADVRLLLISCLARRGDYTLCEQEIAAVQKLAPEDLAVHTSIIGTCFSHGRWDGFKAELARYRALNVQTHPGLSSQTFLDFQESFMDLLFGDMPRGWQRYEERLKFPKELGLKRTFIEPTWDGDTFRGKTLLLWAEQGLGDTLMFVRYLPLVKALGGRIILELQPALRGLTAESQDADLIIPRGAPLPHFDVQASLLSLPWLFGTDLSSVPAEIPYLSVPSGSTPAPELAECLSRSKDGRRIGLVWAGNQGHVRDHERSLRPAALAPLAAIPEVTWFSFQIDPPELPSLPNLISLAPCLKDFTDTAHALQHMDLLITVDTSVAHLAGAMGIPTLLLLSYQPDWRWLLDRDDSPWYPSLRLHRQPTYGDWTSVIKNVVTYLTQEK